MFSKLIHGYLYLVTGFFKVVLCFSRPLPNKTKLKFDQYSIPWVRCAFGAVFTYTQTWNLSFFLHIWTFGLNFKYQVCIYIYLSYVPCKYMFQFLAESMWWCWMVACLAMAGGDWTNPSTVFPKTCQTSSQNIRIYVVLNIFSEYT